MSPQIRRVRIGTPRLLGTHLPLGEEVETPETRAMDARESYRNHGHEPVGSRIESNRSQGMAVVVVPRLVSWPVVLLLEFRAA
jgi:hypothetical protein